MKLTWKKLVILLLMGVSSGLPLALTGGTLQAWMKSENISLTQIGLFAFASTPYSLKFLWAPLMDFITPSPWGRRKSWMLITQIALMASIVGLALTSPRDQIFLFALMSLLISFFSASQDIVLDAWRRESLSDLELGFGSSLFTSAYLFAFRLISGAMALILADYLSWTHVYWIMAAMIGTGVLATLLSEEPPREVDQGELPTFKESVLAPFRDYFSKQGAWFILIFILLYKIGDNMAFQMSIPFYLDIGFSKTEVGAISKIVGWIAMASGGLAGGALLIKISILRGLFLFGILQAISIGAMSVLALIGRNIIALGSVIAIENFAIGMSTAAFVTFMATLTNKKFTATQYALLTALMSIPRTIAAAPTGYLASHLGWFYYFIFCALMAIPGLWMINGLKKIQIQSRSSSEDVLLTQSS